MLPECRTYSGDRAFAAFRTLYAGVAANSDRNDLLIADTLKLIQKDRTPILLTERKEHAAVLASLLEGKVQDAFMLVGSDKQKDKREKLAAVQDIPPDENFAVVANGKYIGEGFDSPRLDTLLLAMPTEVLWFSSHISRTAV